MRGHHVLAFLFLFAFKLEVVEPLSLLRRQLPIKWGAYICLRPGGEGVTIGDEKGGLIIPTNYNLSKTTKMARFYPRHIFYFASVPVNLISSRFGAFSASIAFA